MQFVSHAEITRPLGMLSAVQLDLTFRSLMFACGTYKVDAFCIPTSDPVDRYGLGKAISAFFGRRIIIFNHRRDGLYYLSYEGCFPSPDFVFVTDYDHAVKIDKGYNASQRDMTMFDIFSY